ncbi:MAG: glycerol-phosphate dehydrogenase [Methanobacterium sp.]|jgi:glycerol-1-phosphate dehydrogenase [NAD(P)+]|uniref:NAD(P)-dependent glycerol-1-phosphate dehydrogenase n=1 Tax=Methanobacterium sp. TaxID=2164 RepID=UPI0003C99235|nr:NAD(P)-dependent glycerol-1-phosphate dehydrogenase [Methanobacterium sp.]MDI3550061.1 glycerol-phosphate dehydrogenase [Methanobacterium sp.]CDG64998.1 Glycerol-1-phosphate dehydrogenase [NAD(P)+] [Methanobacterium sp. MB1]
MDFNRVKLPREIHSGPGVIKETGSICKDLKLKGKVLVASGPRTMKVAGEKVISSLQEHDFDVETIIIDSPSTEAVETVQDLMKNTSAVLGVGGGKVIDVAKMAATKAGSHSVSVPTAASHDGISSPRASIKNEKGNISLKAEPPMGVIADTQIISQAPFRLLASGCGDIISNYTAVLDWKLSHRLLNDEYSDSASALSLVTAEMLIKSAGHIKEGLIESAAIVVKALISSGMAISIAGNSRPASGSEHKFSHALDLVAPKPALHGEQCGVGTIMMMYLHGGDWEFIRDTLKAIKAPVNAHELGIEPEYIIKALTIAHTIRKERYTILGDRGLTEAAATKLARKTGVID